MICRSPGTTMADLASHILQWFPPRTSHSLALAGMRWGGFFLPRRTFQKPYTWGPLTFPNRLGLAAGFDKNGTCLHSLARIGFGHVEVGSITLEPSKGNPKKFIRRRPPGEGMINSLGLPNDGARAIAPRLDARPDGLVVGANIAPLQRMRELAELAHRVEADYLTVNLSCPNRPDPSREFLRSVLQVVVQRDAPVLVKLSPDDTDDDIRRKADFYLSLGVSGFVATNTTRKHPLPRGGLSGPPLARRSNEVIRLLRHMSPHCLIIGVGGVGSVEAYHAKIEAGADVVQVYTAFTRQGPQLISDILEHSYV